MYISSSIFVKNICFTAAIYRQSLEFYLFHKTKYNSIFIDFSRANSWILYAILKFSRIFDWYVKALAPTVILITKEVF